MTWGSVLLEGPLKPLAVLVDSFVGVVRVLDYSLEVHPSVASLKEALKREWRALTIEEINATIAGWMPRLDKMLAAHGGRFE